MVNNKIKAIIQEQENATIEMRRYLHAHPEQSLLEFETTNYIAKQLDELAIPYRRMKSTGIIGEIKGASAGKTVLLRADIDALSINELNTVDYKSTNEGTMHACGHDSHISMLMTALKALNEIKDQIKGTVRFVFQPAEEVAAGAKQAIEQGVLEGVDNVFGMHIWTVDETGQVSCPVGPSFAACDQFTVKFTGKGGHAAQPHMTNDALVIASQYVVLLQDVVARRVDPMNAAVLTVGKIESGDRFNIIAETATLEGTVRTFDPNERDMIEGKIIKYAEHIAEMHDAVAEVEFNRLTDAVNNEAHSAKLVQAVAREAFGDDSVQDNVPTMGAEDFGFYMTQVPGAFATVGAKNVAKETDFPHHSARFNIDEDALVRGAELYAQYALAYLNQDEF